MRWLATHAKCRKCDHVRTVDEETSITSRGVILSCPSCGFRASEPIMLHHDWVPRNNVVKWVHCGFCGTIRNDKNDNKPCKGPGRVGPRAASKGGTDVDETQRS